MPGALTGSRCEGWAIVQRIAAMHLATALAARSASLGGFAVEINFPASPTMLSAAQMRIHARPNIDPPAQTHVGAPRIMPWYFQHTNEDFTMNKNQIKGKAKDIAGKVQEAR